MMQARSACFISAASEQHDLPPSSISWLCYSNEATASLTEAEMELPKNSLASPTKSLVRGSSSFNFL